MSIRRKVLVLYALTALGALSLLVAGAKVILLERFAQLEQDEMRLDMDRLLAATGGLLDAMQATAKDYGNWDDVYAYLATPNDAFIQANFVDATFQNLKLDMVLLADASGKVVYAQGYDLDNKAMREVPASWVELFRAYGFFSQELIEGDVKGRKGLLLTDEGPLMVVAKPVLTSEEKGPSRGLIVMGRLLGEDEVEYISHLALLKIAWLKLDELPVNIGKIDSGQPSPGSGVPVAVQTLSPEVVEGLCLARDMMGAPIGAWRIEKDRTLYAKGLAGTVYFLAVMLAGCVVFAVGFAVILERVVLGRIARLNGQVEAIAADKDPSSRVDVQGEDEIGDLGGSINGMLTGLEKSSRDMVAIAEELRAARDAAEHASQAKSRFLATMSHEIRTPLNALAGFTELACDSNNKENFQEYMEDIRGASEHLRNLIEDILDFSKIEAGRLELENTSFNLGRLLDEVGALYKALARAKGLSFELTAPLQARTRVMGDPLRLRQVLSNLLDNAEKFTERGTVSLQVDVPEENDQAVTVRFEVADTGIGISPEALEGVFSPFTQEDSSTTRRYGGTGLGLAICREIVALMGARLEVESELGGGSRFHFQVRFDRAPGQDGQQACESQPVDLTGMLVLVVEDNAFNRKIVKQVLEGAGAETVLAGNGTQAIMAALGHDLDLIVMDMHMPEMDGLEAARAIRSNPGCKDVPIIALTAGALAGDRALCLEAGMNDYLTKPVTRKDLLDAAARWARKGASSRPTSGPARKCAAFRPAGPKIPLPPLEGVDLEAALAIYEGETWLLVRILGQFPESFRNAVQDMGAMVDRGELTNAWMAAHGLKGAAASIAALGVVALARRLEEALAKKDAAVAKKLLAELDPVLLSLFERIGTFLSDYSRAQDAMEC